MGTRILVVDNYDSFVFNLVQYLQQLGAECTVVRNDEVSASHADQYDGVLISPGPGTPEEAGISIEMIKYAAEIKKPLLGVCLGHQGIGVAYGATVNRAPELLHGKTSVALFVFSGRIITKFENVSCTINKCEYPFIVFRDSKISIFISSKG